MSDHFSPDGAPDDRLDSTETPTGPESFPASGPNSLASPWLRVLGRILDSLILAVVLVPITLPFVDFELDPAAGTFDVPVGFLVAIVAVSAVYEVSLFALRGQTVAMMLLRMRAARFVDGEKPTWGESSIRWLLPNAIAAVPIAFISILSLVVYARMFWDPLRQGFHDKAAGTVIVRTQ